MRIQSERRSTIVLQQQLSPVDEEGQNNGEAADEYNPDLPRQEPRTQGFSTDSIDIAFSPTPSPLNPGPSVSSILF